MTQDSSAPQAHLKHAQALVSKTAAELRETLVMMAASLIPFPYFLGSTEVQAIEAEPGGAARADRGCIVVCADGDMYEFAMKMQAPDATGDFGLDREDSVKPIELPPEEYIIYAYNGVKEIAGILEEQQARGRKYSF